MSDDLTKPETCGTCKFGHRVDIQAVECRGIPPTPSVVASRQGLMGREEMAVQLLRARLPANEPACALYKFKAQIIDLNAVKGTTQ